MKTDEGYELIRQLIDSRAQQDPKIRSVQELIADGSADFKDTSEYSRRSSEILGTSLSEHILELDDEAREDVCKKLLHDGYEDINDVLAEVQTSLDEKTGVNIRPKKPPFQTERVATFAHSLADHTVADHVIKRRAKNGAANISMSDHDRYMKENAKLRHNAGLKCYIERDTDGSCCEWCSKMAGSYVYGEEPKDVYRRHDNCGCSVTYKNGKQRQNVWSKKTWEADKDERISKTAGKEPTVFGKAEAQAKQSEILAQRRLTFEAKGGILEGEYDERDIMRAITQKGTNFVTKDPNDPESLFGELVELVKPDDRYYDIKAHGSPEAVKLFGSVVDAQTLARVILMREDYNEKPIRLLCCETGKTINGTCFAKELSEFLKVDVLAPTEDFWVSTLGEIKVEHKKTGKKGYMKQFIYKG